MQLGRLYRHKGQFERALDTLHEGLTSAQHSDARAELRKAHRALAEAYKNNRQYREACLHIEKHETRSQEVFDCDSDLRLQALRVQHEVAQTERENSTASRMPSLPGPWKNSMRSPRPYKQPTTIR